MVSPVAAKDCGLRRLRVSTGKRPTYNYPRQSSSLRLPSSPDMTQADIEQQPLLNEYTDMYDEKTPSEASSTAPGPFADEHVPLVVGRPTLRARAGQVKEKFMGLGWGKKALIVLAMMWLGLRVVAVSRFLGAHHRGRWGRGGFGGFGMMRCGGDQPYDDVEVYPTFSFWTSAEEQIVTVAANYGSPMVYVSSEGVSQNVANASFTLDLPRPLSVEVEDGSAEVYIASAPSSEEYQASVIVETTLIGDGDGSVVMESSDFGDVLRIMVSRTLPPLD